MVAFSRCLLEIIVRVEHYCYSQAQQYKGNYHLLAIIDGKERKFVIRKNTAEHEEISRVGLSNLSVEYLKELVSRYMQ